MPKLHNAVPPTDEPGASCSKPDCSEPHYAKGLCRRHYDLDRPKRGGSLVPKEPRFCHCGKPALYLDGCQNHHKAAQRHARGLQKPGPKPTPGTISHQKLPPEVLRARKMAKKESTSNQLGGACVNGHALTPDNTRVREDPRYTGGQQVICKICFREA